MARRKQKENTDQPEMLTMDEMLDLIDESGATGGVFVGRKEDGALVFYSTVPTAGYYHHLLNSALFQLNVMESNQLEALRQQAAQEADTNDE